MQNGYPFLSAQDETKALKNQMTAVEEQIRSREVSLGGIVEKGLIRQFCFRAVAGMLLNRWASN